MTCIVLTTLIKAAPEVCFDISRDADVHLFSTRHTNERVVAGRTTGLFELNDFVTWEATHLGIKQRLSTKITAFQKPFFFEDTMQKGAFKRMRHEHHFQKTEEGTLMKDIFEYEVPFGCAGSTFDRIYLKSYMMRLLKTRNNTIKVLAEKSTEGAGLK